MIPRQAGRRFEAVALAAPLGHDRRVSSLRAELEERGMPIVVGDGVATAVSEWWRLGIHPSDVLVLTDGSLEDYRQLSAGRQVVLVASPAEARAILRDQLARRRRMDLPEPPEQAPGGSGDGAAWIVDVQGSDPRLEGIRNVRLAMVGGATGTLGCPPVEYAPALRGVFTAGLYVGDGPESRLLLLPDWTRLAGRLISDRPVRRILDMRTGIVHCELATARGRVRTVSFASRARPGVYALRAGGSGAIAAGAREDGKKSEGRKDPTVGRFRGSCGGAAAAMADTTVGKRAARRLDRVFVVRASSRRVPGEAEARATVAEAVSAGFDSLLFEHRAAWAARWDEMDIRIEGDQEMQRAVRFALFALAAHGVDRGESAIGARGVTGPKYRGHVFWDTDVYVLPFLAATYPRAARTVLQYRTARLDAARDAASEAGLSGARFPWESAADGREVTPHQIERPGEAPLQVLTGRYELHITADIAWAAATYHDWTGDGAFEAGPGGQLLFETARYWASRIELAADGSAHISDVIGPDEYHPLVADNAYTNVMARWNLRRAAAWKAPLHSGARRSSPPARAERTAWLNLAERLVDGFDARTGLYEQFRGYFGLTPVKIAELTARPLSGEVYLGRDRVAETQCVKQPDVLMLYQLIPGELAPGTLPANLDFYDPRTSHGSSLSPGVHATLLARVGKTDEALAALRMISHIDLDDSSRGTSDGLHMAALGSIWQAIVFGFAGVRLVAGGIAVEPHLPSGWHALEVPLRVRGRRVRVRIEQDRLSVRAERPIVVEVAGLGPLTAGPSGLTAVRGGRGWEVAR